LIRAASATARGEASTSYTKHPRYEGAAERAARMIPDARFVYVVRDPVERIRSHYEHNVVLGEETDPLEVALSRNPAYLDYSRYSMQLDRWLEWFPRDRFLVITSEDLRSDRARMVSEVLAFIGADARRQPIGLDVEHYRTEERPQYRRPVALARNALRTLLPGRPDIWRGQFLPHVVKRALARQGVKRAATEHRDAAKRAVVPSELAAGIRAELADDVAGLRPFLGPGPDRWWSTHAA